MSKAALKAQAEYAKSNKLKTKQELDFIKKKDVLNPKLRLVRDDDMLDDKIYYSHIEVRSNSQKIALKAPYCIRSHDFCMNFITRECGFKLREIEQISIKPIKIVGDTTVK